MQARAWLIIVMLIAPFFVGAWVLLGISEIFIDTPWWAWVIGTVLSPVVGLAYLWFKNNDSFFGG